MLGAIGGILREAAGDLRRSVRTLVVADLAWKAIAFALLTPLATLLLRSMIFDRETRAIADADLALFFLTDPVGLVALLLGAAVALAIAALESACLMAIGIASATGRSLGVRGALVFTLLRGPRVLLLAAHIALRVLLLAAPFLAAGGLAGFALIRDHDINYYLAERPAEFWAAAGVAAALLVVVAALLLRAAARWALALPLLLFEEMPPRRALAESVSRTAGDRRVVLGAVASWALLALGLVAGATAAPEALGRWLAPRFAASLTPLLLFISGLALLAGLLALLASVAGAALFALVLLRLYLRLGGPRPAGLPGSPAGGAPPAPPRIPRWVGFGAVAAAVLGVAGVALLAAGVASRSRPVAVIAHRGSSAAAPENTLAAFRLAGEEGADFVELDVQESKDGEVLVVHDSDLMKAGGSPLRVSESTAAELRTVDVGSRAGARFAAERVPTLAEALEACRGRSRVIVELKSYGRGVRLEERVVAVVEAAGMEAHCVFMSLDHGMVRKLKALRPAWRCGLLVAKAIGDLTSLGADFLAVEAGLATRPFVRRAHGAGQAVYVWTVNDPARMLQALARGVDGLITDRPALARQVVESRAGMSAAERILVALLVRLGADTEALVGGEALRP